jgi:hypothetical protein
VLAFDPDGSEGLIKWLLKIPPAEEQDDRSTVSFAVDVIYPKGTSLEQAVNY